MSRLTPIKTGKPSAPDFLLNIIRCNCKTSSRNTCGTITWSCKKNGRHYVNACGDCRCAEYNNAQTDIEITLNEDVGVDDDRNIPVGTRYCSDIGFLLDLHRDIDQLHIEIEVTSLYDIFFQHHNDAVAIT